MENFHLTQQWLRIIRDRGGHITIDDLNMLSDPSNHVLRSLVDSGRLTVVGSVYSISPAGLEFLDELFITEVMDS